jgi:opacity protein-like surface antigen
MKTKIYTKVLMTAALACFTLLASAQVRFGPVAGVNLANISGDGDDQNAMKIGLHIGGVVEIAISDNFMVAPGVLYSMKGTQDKDDSKFKLNANYIEVPVNAKYKLESGLNFFAGPYLGLLMSAKATDGTNDTDVKDFFKSSDFGLNGGIGFDLESGLGFSAQYGMSLSSISDDSSVDSKNTVIGISVRYMLGDK